MTYPRELIEAVRRELAGNARRDLLGWAYRIEERHKAGQAIGRGDLDRARLVLSLNKGGR